MTLEEMQRLWPLAKALHEARRDLAWGKKLGAVREPWPEWSTAYSHNPIAYVDLALAQAEAISADVDTHCQALGCLAPALRQERHSNAISAATARRALQEVMRYYPTSQDAFPAHAKLAGLA